jgi:hypothetical protein
MNATVARLRGPNNEGLLVAIILIVVVGMSLASPAFFSCAARWFRSSSRSASCWS